jgi:hypothetical protein
MFTLLQPLVKLSLSCRCEQRPAHPRTGTANTWGEASKSEHELNLTLRDYSRKSSVKYVDSNLFCQRKLLSVVWGCRCLKIRAFWDVEPCSILGVVRRFRGAYCLHHDHEYIAVLMQAVRISETSVYPKKTTLHGATSQKAVIFILATVRTYNLTRRRLTSRLRHFVYL